MLCKQHFFKNAVHICNSRWIKFHRRLPVLAWQKQLLFSDFTQKTLCEVSNNTLIDCDIQTVYKMIYSTTPPQPDWTEIWQRAGWFHGYMLFKSSIATLCSRNQDLVKQANKLKLFKNCPVLTSLHPLFILVFVLSWQEWIWCGLLPFLAHPRIHFNAGYFCEMRFCSPRL